MVQLSAFSWWPITGSEIQVLVLDVMHIAKSHRPDYSVYPSHCFFTSIIVPGSVFPPKP